MTGSSVSPYLVMILGGAVVVVWMLMSVRSGARTRQAMRQQTHDLLAAEVGVPALDQAAIASGIAAITQADPDFDTEVFMQRAKTAFTVLQEGSDSRDLARARAFMAPELYASWSAQISQAPGDPGKLVRRALVATNIVEAKHGATLDHITVRMQGQTLVYYRETPAGEMSTAPRNAVPFFEYWTFTRAGGAGSAGPAGLTTTTCPTCGAPLSLNEIGECSHCHTAITSGRFDWVVSDIKYSNQWAEQAV